MLSMMYKKPNDSYDFDGGMFLLPFMVDANKPPEWSKLSKWGPAFEDFMQWLGATNE